MIKSIYRLDNIVQPLVSKLAGYSENKFIYGKDPTIGFLYNDELVGGVVYHNYIENACIEISVGTKTPKVFTSRQLMYEVFSYPFLQLKVKTLVAKIAETNEESIKFTEKFGYSYAGYIRYGCNETAGAIIYDLTKEEWLNQKWLQTYTSKL